MNRPDPNKSRIRDIFTQTFANSKKVDELEQLKRIGPLLFTEAEIYATPWPLDRLLRKFCVDNSITEAYFAEKYKIFALQELGMHPTQASNNRSNLTKALKAGHITYKRLVEVICNVLGYVIEEMEFKISDKTGESQSINFKETNESVSNTFNSTEPYTPNVNFKGDDYGIR